VSDSSLIGSKFKPDLDDESGLANKLILQGCKVIGPFAALKNIIIVNGSAQDSFYQGEFSFLYSDCAFMGSIFVLLTDYEMYHAQDCHRRRGSVE